ncbi:GntR family transcriptional regulator [Alicyclobacillus shizuokensis]|uniref:GntR family transcriptional regulator n=1 Tax=Alicyclobacillus shizuokensis TaxID=392014 RepID=UPI0009F9A7F4|nr:GntR family transcriptional regulator [Alicyclobacillus shizuokensis]
MHEHTSTPINTALPNDSSDFPVTREKHVVDRLRHAILVGQYRPGERLDQAEIAKQFQVSLSPVREAIRTLSAEGLVTIYPHRGAFVTERSPAEIEELHFIRALLEGAAIRRAVPYMTPERLSRLREIIHLAENSDDFVTIQALNHQFHQTIYTACEQPNLLELVMHLRNKVAPYIRLYLDYGMRSEAWESHRKIYEACAKGNAALAEQEMHAHINQVCQGILASLRNDATATDASKESRS